MNNGGFFEKNQTCILSTLPEKGELVVMEGRYSEHQTWVYMVAPTLLDEKGLIVIVIYYGYSSGSGQD